jgi:hypothetical protein
MNNLLFDEWFYEIEGYGLRAERLFEDMPCLTQQESTRLIGWLKAAYSQGAEDALKHVS